ncbi:hypothetical protein PGTUg99_027877 [Puccinia graminis f. sp. tritici]|uniref:Uncharacterized protein n=1 Tax=Puccinia graminis f. sp. tritici TaxID=56615 RepID=A0A5B0N5B8_PUCGR|nr:hypothetical protein PGTUg99_027877 [Puccinia graminis f. sp. tritici]
MTVANKRRPPDNSALIDFQPYNLTNHKNELTTFIYKVDPHAEIPTKIKVNNNLRDLAQEYLEKLQLREAALESPTSISSLDQSSSITSQSSSFSSQSSSITSQSSSFSSQSSSITSQSSSFSSQSTSCASQSSSCASQSSSFSSQSSSITSQSCSSNTIKSSITGKDLLQNNTSSGFQKTSSIANNSIQNDKRFRAAFFYSWSNLINNPKRHKRPAEDEFTSSKNSSESGSSTSRSDSLESESLESESDQSELRTSRSKGKKKAQATAKPSKKAQALTKRSRDKYWDDALEAHPKLKSAVKSVKPLKSALTKSNQTDKLFIDLASEDRRYGTRSGYRPSPRPPSPDYAELFYAEEGRQDANAYSRPLIAPFQQLPPDHEQLNQDPNSHHPHNPLAKRRRYIRLDERHASDSRFTPASVPFCPTLEQPQQPQCPRSPYSNLAMSPYAPSHLAMSPYSTSQPHSQANATAAYGYQSTYRPTSTSPFISQPSVAPSYGYNTSQSNVAPSYGYNTSQSNVAPALGYHSHHQTSVAADGRKPTLDLSGPKPYDYSQYWTQSQNKNEPNKNPSGQGSVPSFHPTFNFSNNPEPLPPPRSSQTLGNQTGNQPPTLPSFGQTLEHPPPPQPRRFGTSGTQGNQPRTEPPTLPSQFGQSVTQENSLPIPTQENPPPIRFGETTFRTQENPPPIRFGETTFPIQNSGTTFRPTTAEPTTNNPFMISSNFCNSNPAPPPPLKSNNLWGVKPILKSNPAPIQSLSFSTSSHARPEQPTNSFALFNPSRPNTAERPVTNRAASKFERLQAYNSSIPSPPTSPLLAVSCDPDVDDLCDTVSRLFRPIAPIRRKKALIEAKNVHFADTASILSAAPRILADFLGNATIDPQLTSGPSAGTQPPPPPSNRTQPPPPPPSNRNTGTQPPPPPPPSNRNARTQPLPTTTSFGGAPIQSVPSDCNTGTQPPPPPSNCTQPPPPPSNRNAGTQPPPTTTSFGRPPVESVPSDCNAGTQPPTTSFGRPPVQSPIEVPRSVPVPSSVPAQPAKSSILRPAPPLLATQPGLSASTSRIPKSIFHLTLCKPTLVDKPTPLAETPLPPHEPTPTKPTSSTPPPPTTPPACSPPSN